MKIIAEPERLDARVPLGIIAVTLLTLLLSAGLTLGVRAFAQGELHSSAVAAGPRPVTPESVPPAQPSGLFERHTPPGATRQLPPSSSEYGWVDRQQGLVRIPLERAKQLYLAPQAGPTQPASQTEGSQR
jgi:hypothetical protein